MTMPSVDGSLDSVPPPRWAEAALRLLLRPDVAETVSGDLLEEYREVVQPLRGTWRADVWFVRQVGGFVWQATWLPVTVGLLLGAGLGVLNLFETARHPLEEDDAGALLLWVIVVSGVRLAGSRSIRTCGKT